MKCRQIEVHHPEAATLRRPALTINTQGNRLLDRVHAGNKMLYPRNKTVTWTPSSFASAHDSQTTALS